VLAVTPAKYDVDFWFHVGFPWRRWILGRGRSEDTPAVRFSFRSLQRLFDRFIEHRFYKRHLRRREVPHIWRWMPHSLLERMMGRILVVKAFKPVSTKK
jgi:hypothetical protein